MYGTMPASMPIVDCETEVEWNALQRDEDGVQWHVREKVGIPSTTFYLLIKGYPVLFRYAAKDKQV